VSKHYQDSQYSTADVVVLGIGNLLLGDEGVGIHVIESMDKSYTFSPSINFIDGGTSGIDLIPYFEECKKMIIIDAVDSHEEPGYITILKNEEIHYRFNTKLSLHYSGLSDVLSIMKLQEITAPDMILIGVQPKIVEIGIELSNTISEKMEHILKIITNKLEEWGIECKPISG